MDEVEKYYHGRSSLGQKPSLREMIAFCRKRRIRWTRKKLRELKSRWMFTAMFARPSRPQKHMGAAVQRYGLVQVRLRAVKAIVSLTARRDARSTSPTIAEYRGGKLPRAAGFREVTVSDRVARENDHCTRFSLSTGRRDSLGPHRREAPTR